MYVYSVTWLIDCITYCIDSGAQLFFSLHYKTALLYNRMIHLIMPHIVVIEMFSIDRH